MITKFNKLIKFAFSLTNNPVETFLNSNPSELKMIVQKGRSKYGSKIHVPPNPLSREQVVDFFNKYELK